MSTKRRHPTDLTRLVLEAVAYGDDIAAGDRLRALELLAAVEEQEQHPFESDIEHMSASDLFDLFRPLGSELDAMISERLREREQEQQRLYELRVSELELSFDERVDLEVKRRTGLARTSRLREHVPEASGAPASAETTPSLPEPDSAARVALDALEVERRWPNEPARSIFRRYR